ncbi:MAG: DUF362 domain-containing protein [Candidatus Latescibacterota bacterium]
MRSRHRGLVGAGVAAVALLAGMDLTGQVAGPPEGRQHGLVDAVSAATRPGMSTVGLVVSDYPRLAQPAPRAAELTEAQVEDMVRYAIALAGGLSSRIAPDAEWVVIKPNIVELKQPGSGVITDWRVVKAVAKAVHEVVPQARITVAEGGAWIPPDRPDVLHNSFSTDVGDGFAVAGYRTMLQSPDLQGMEVDLLDLNFDETAEVSVPDGGYVADTYRLPMAVLECDFLISVPVLKVIGAVNMTGVLKNFVGIAPGMVYGWPKMTGYPAGGPNPGLPHGPGVLDEVIVDLVSVAEADFAVVDAIVGMERAKTDRDDGRPVRLNTVIVSPDLVAADAVAAQLIGFNPADLEYLTLAAYRGLGQCDPATIRVNGSPLEGAVRRFEKYPVEEDHYGQGCRTWLLAGPLPADPEAPREQVDVARPGALPGQNGWSAPIYFHDDRIDLDRYFHDPVDCRVYAYTEVAAPADQEAELWVGSDEGLRVWLNGEPVYDFRGRRHHRLPNDRPRVRLHAGDNALLVRADQTRGRFDFSLNLCEVEPDPRYEGNRVKGLQFAVPTVDSLPAVETLELAVPRAGTQIPAGAVLLDSARFVRSFDLLIGSLEGCLRGAGEPVSPVQVMGGTGHAFRLSVADSLRLDWAAQTGLTESLALYEGLGHEVRCVTAAADDPEFPDRQQEAWAAIRASIDGGMPATARFGPFYWVVKGYHADREQCFISTFMAGTEAVELADLGMGSDEGPGGLEVLILGATRPADPRETARRALDFAVGEARAAPHGRSHRGLDGLDHWVRELEAGRLGDAFGLRLTAGVTAQRRAQAGPYLRETAALFPDPAAGLLRGAAACYEAEAERLAQVAAMFPLLGAPEPAADVADPEARARAAGLLREAREWEARGVAQVEEALGGMR